MSPIPIPKPMLLLSFPSRAAVPNVPGMPHPTARGAG